MNFNVIVTPPFKRQSKKLKKKYPSIKAFIDDKEKMDTLLIDY